MTSPDPQHRPLTPRQESVLKQMLNGATAKEISQSLRISTATVHSHMRSIYAAFGVRNRARAVIAAMEHGYLQGEGAAALRWNSERTRILHELRDAWRPCEVHSVHRADCATCARAATLTYAMLLVRDPWSPHPDPPPTRAAPAAPARPRLHDPRPAEAARLVRRRSEPLQPSPYRPR
ncbi:response regulator transcription factor [Peterkaempfera bronchialis]|uniref:DNA-binding response regulator n=1 Tax=Peterkaempfera bronchialis TaxID=2126346 RepID=A0A345SV22_9ACTN|nr:LuxR C-terminal-related transcriptional regulator [Peterkaempfera bronchialis]AXI77577.1 DNA-binding response regulator [Peterkaempfera bronchialis]